MRTDRPESEYMKLQQRMEKAMGNYITTYTGKHVEPAIPELHIDPDYSMRPFQDVEKEYLELFYRFSGEERLNLIMVSNKIPAGAKLY